MAHAITVELSDDTYHYLMRTAELSHEPVGTILERSLAHSLPPLLEDIPSAYQAEVYPLLGMDVAALQAEAKHRFPSDRWTAYETLLAQKKQRALTPAEEVQLDGLRRAADVLMFRKAYAAVLLKRRGYAVSLATLDGAA